MGAARVKKKTKMNILQTIIAKITSVIVTILISVGLLTAPVSPAPAHPIPEIPAITTPESPKPTPVAKIPPPASLKPQIMATSMPPTPVSLSAPIPMPTVITPPVVYIPIYVPQSTPIPTVPEPVVEKDKEKEKPKESLVAIEIISPFAGKGIGPRLDFNGTDMGYVASSTVENESNYIMFGLIVYDEDGKNTNTAVVTVIATDSSQNKTMTSTGNQKTMYYDGIARVMWYYPFNYEFRFPGQHTITFTAYSLTKSVTLSVK